MVVTAVRTSVTQSGDVFIHHFEITENREVNGEWHSVGTGKFIEITGASKHAFTPLQPIIFTIPERD